MAIVERNFVRDLIPAKSDGDVVLGDDWVTPDSAAPNEIRARRERRGLFSLRASPLTRKIITFNLIALNVLVAGILYLNSSRESLAVQRAASLVSEAELIADVVEAQLPEGQAVDLSVGEGVDIEKTLAGLDLRSGIQVFVFDADGALISRFEGNRDAMVAGRRDGTENKTILTNGLNWLWNAVSSPFKADVVVLSIEERLQPVVAETLASGAQIKEDRDEMGATLLAVATPIEQGETAVGVVAIASASGEIDRLVRGERERVLQMFIIATLVSIGLSLVLASTIANPLADLAAAAELGRDKDARKMNPGRIRIPDLTARPDEIGRLSGALRGMVSALYNRIEGNEQFAADVAHEIKIRSRLYGLLWERCG